MAFFRKLKQSFGLMFSFFADSWDELKKVRWPSRKELTSYTFVVLAMVFFMTLYLRVLDIGISAIVKAII